MHQKRNYLKNFFFLNILFIPIFISPAFSETLKERYVLEDRNIKSICIFPFKAKKPELGRKVSDYFFKILSDNDSKIEVKFSENDTQNSDSILIGELKEYNSEIKKIIFSDSSSYDIIEQQIRVGIEIIIKDSVSGEILWKRKASKYNTQRWIDFSRPRIGANNLIDYFSVPSQITISMKKKYSEELMIENTVIQVIEDLAGNLVKLK